MQCFSAHCFMQINRYRAINETEKVTVFMCDSLSMCYEQLIS